MANPVPTVYHGGPEGHSSSVYTPVENLLSHLRETSPLKNDDFYKCPSFTGWAKNKLVMKCPADIEVKGNTNQYVQFLLSQYLFFADSEVKMTVYPPFLDFNNIKGVAGEMDISKWFRAVQPACVLDETGTISIPQGEAILYVGFDREVKLQKVIFPNTLIPIANGVQEYKSIGMKGRSLRRLYDYFLKSGTHKIILKQIKDFNDL